MATRTTRVSSTAPPTRKSQNIIVSDFSGGVNPLDSGIPFQDNQGTEYLNAEFNQDGLFVKRRGFQQIKLAKNAEPTESSTHNIKIIDMHIQLASLVEVLTSGDNEGVTVAPWKYIVIQKTPKIPAINSKIIRQLMVYDVQNGIYKVAKYKGWNVKAEPYKYLDMSYQGVSAENPSTGVIFTVSGSASTSMDYLYIGEENIYSNVEWEYSLNKENTETNSDATFFTFKDINYIKCGSNEFSEDKEYFLLEHLENEGIDKFKQVKPKQTTVAEESVLGWNLFNGFVYQTKVNQRADWKSVINWGSKNKGLNVVCNLLGSELPFMYPVSTSTQPSIYIVEGVRTNHPGAQPGNKILNISLIDPVDKFEMWADYTEIPNKRTWSYNDYISSDSYNDVGRVYRLNDDGTEQEKPEEKYYELIFPYTYHNMLYDVAKFTIIGHLERGQKVVKKAYNKVKSFTITPLEWRTDLDTIFRFKYRTPDGVGNQHDYTFSSDKKEAQANFISMGINPEAYADAQDLKALSITNKMFSVGNYVAYMTDKRIWFSMPRFINWVPHNFDLEFPLKDPNDKLIGTAYLHGQLVVFSKFSTFRVPGQTPSIAASEGQDTFRIEPLDFGQGALTKDAIVSLEDQIFYLASSGIRRLFRLQWGIDNYNSKSVDNKIKNQLQLGKNNNSQAKATVYQDQLIIYIPSANKIFVRGKSLPGAKNRWTVWETELLKDNKPFYGIKSSSSTRQVYFNFDGRIYQLGDNQYYDGKVNALEADQKLYECRWTSGLLDGGKPESDKKWNRLKINTYIPGKIGTELNVKAYVGTKGGFDVINKTKVELEAINEEDVVKEIKPPTLDFNAGTSLNSDFTVGVSRVGNDQVPIRALKFKNKLKGPYLTLELFTKNNKPFMLSFVSVKFKYKKSSYKERIR